MTNGIPWGQMSRADFDKSLAAKGHKRPDAPALFYVPTPEREPKPVAAPEQLPGQLAMFATPTE